MTELLLHMNNYSITKVITPYQTYPYIIVIVIKFKFFIDSFLLYTKIVLKFCVVDKYTDKIYSQLDVQFSSLIFSLVDLLLILSKLRCNSY